MTLYHCRGVITNTNWTGGFETYQLENATDKKEKYDASVPTCIKKSVHAYYRARIVCHKGEFMSEWILDPFCMNLGEMCNSGFKGFWSIPMHVLNELKIKFGMNLACRIFNIRDE